MLVFVNSLCILCVENKSELMNHLSKFKIVILFLFCVQSKFRSQTKYFISGIMFNPIEWWKKYKKEWQLKTPKQKWLLIYSIGAKMSDLIGVTTFGDVRNYWYSYFPGFVGLIYFSTVIYTLGFYFTKGEFARGMQCTCTIGVVFSVHKLIFI